MGARISTGLSDGVVATPMSLIKACEKRFGPIRFDLAATRENSRCGEHFYSLEEDALKQDWAAKFNTLPLDSFMWLNPPYNDIEPWARKCIHEGPRGARILLLTPASVGANWFFDHVYKKASVFFLKGKNNF